MKEMLLEILHNEVKVAVGCTEPVAVALACAKALKELGEEVESAYVGVSCNIFKNGMGVGIPATEYTGLDAAACLGLSGVDSDHEMELLKHVSEDQRKVANKLFNERFVQVVVLKDTPDRIYIEVKLEGKNNVVVLKVIKRHDEVSYLQVNDDVLIDVTKVNNLEIEKNDYSKLYEMTINQLIDEVKSMSLEELEFLYEGIVINKEIALLGIDKKSGAQIGASLESEVCQNELMGLALTWAAAASDARMSGAIAPVMTSGGSGNNGISVMIPIAAYEHLYNPDKEEVVKAIALANLINLYIKGSIGRLSPICAVAVASNTGAACGIGLLMGMSNCQIKEIINYMLASLSGTICDGAKLGCAAKVVSGTATAIIAVYVVKNGTKIPHANGIVCNRVEDSIKALKEIANIGMRDTDKTIVDTMVYISQHC